jgi:Lambda phage tail tube protein, TTP
MAKFTGKGAEILVLGGGATPAYKPVGQVAEIGSIDVTADEVDVTTLDAGDYRDYLQGFKDPGECQLTVLFDPALADQDESADGLFGLFTSGETRDWVIRFNSSAVGGETFGTFKGFLRDWSFGALNPDDPQEIQPTIRIAGPITLTDTMPVPTITGTRGSDELQRKQDELARRRAALEKEAAALRAQLESEPIAA